jgi:hypothetical protein
VDELSEPMSQKAAAAEATRRNLEAGARGEPDHYWIEAQGLDGQWRVERRGARKTWREAGAEALRSLLRPWRWAWW